MFRMIAAHKRPRLTWPVKATGTSIHQLAKAASRNQLNNITISRLTSRRHRRGLRGHETEGFAQ